MSDPKLYFPHAVFAGEDDPAPRVLISPHRYIQGPGVLDSLGRFLSVLPSTRPLVLISAGGDKRFGQRIRRSMAQNGVEPKVSIFQGECSHENVARIIASLGDKVDAVVAVGGGKCLDTGKCVAWRLGVPIAICPTIASTDAPCSAVSVMYTEDGVGKGPEFFPNSPALVMVDSQIIAHSPVRHLVAGMGDGLATFFEARTSFNNPQARSMVGARPTIAVLALAELGAKTIFGHGQAAMEAVKQKQVNDSLERIIEANTYLSGVGFESGGLSSAHAVAAGLTVIPVLHTDYLHGELVGVGVMTQAFLEGNEDEARQVADFLATVGLPVHLGQLSLDPEADAGIIMEAMQAAVESTLTGTEPFEVTAEKLRDAFMRAHELGLATAGRIGDAAYKALHG